MGCVAIDGGGGTAEQGDDVSIFRVSFFLALTSWFCSKFLSISNWPPVLCLEFFLTLSEMGSYLQEFDWRSNTTKKHVSSPKDRFFCSPSFPSKWPLPSLPPWGFTKMGFFR